MFGVFCKSCLSALLALIYVMSPSLMASQNCNICEHSKYECNPCECHSCECNKIYFGAFGGGIFSNSSHMSQMGTVFFTEAEGGPLAVLAQGNVDANTTGFGGVQFGYEWSCSNWIVTPALELEAFFYSSSREGQLSNPTDRLPEHEFVNSFRTNMSVLLVNALFSGNNSCWGISPYVGGGLGAVRISLKNATSFQISPPEEGINHFNSRQHDSCWTFAAQLKAGLRYEVCRSFHVFGEYRYLFVDCSNYILGSAVDPTHAPTSPWNVKLDDTHYHALSIGIRYDL